MVEKKTSKDIWERTHFLIEIPGLKNAFETKHAK